MVKLGRTSNIEIEELMRKNAEELKKLSDKVDSVTDGKKKMEDLLAEVEKKKAEKEEKAKLVEKEEKAKRSEDSHEGHDHKDGHEHGHGNHHVHTLAFTEKGIGKCTGKDCLTEFSLGPVISEDDWNKDMPDPSKYAEIGFDDKRVHNIYECDTCNNKVVGPKRKDVGAENKLTDCPFCKSPDAKFLPVDLRKLKDKIKRK
jgi:hypothetical protein